jgi:hypothetical protein
MDEAGVFFDGGDEPERARTAEPPLDNAQRRLRALFGAPDKVRVLLLSGGTAHAGTIETQEAVAIPARFAIERLFVHKNVNLVAAIPRDCRRLTESVAEQGVGRGFVSCRHAVSERSDGDRLACGGGRGDRARTCNFLLPKQARYQLRHTPRAGSEGLEPSYTSSKDSPGTAPHNPLRVRSTSPSAPRGQTLRPARPRGRFPPPPSPSDTPRTAGR